MQQLTTSRATRIGVAVLGALLMLGTASGALAEKESKSKKAQGKLVELDVPGGTMTVVEKGKKQVYQVIYEGSVMTRTTSTMNAKPVKLTDIPIGAPVIVYWKPDESDKKIRHARKVDAPKVDEDMVEEYE
jgi:hypothetical protein